MTLLRAFAATFLAALVLSLVAAPAQAQGDYTPSGGPDINLVGNDVNFLVDSTGQELDCPTFNLLGSVVDPGDKRPFSDDGLLVDDLTATGCTNPIAGPTEVTPHSDWKVAVTGPESGSVSPVNLHDVEVTVNALSGACTYDVVGDLDGTFDTANQVFEPTTSNLEVAASPTPSGSLCDLIGVRPGVGVSIDDDAYWTNTPPAGSGPLVFADGYTPDGGPDVNFVSSNVAFIVDSTGQEWTCPTFNLLGHVIDPGVSRDFGDEGLLLNDLTAIGCTNPIAGPTDVTPHGDWKFTVVGPEVGSVSPVNVHDVEFTASWVSGGCTYDIVGELDGTFDDTTQMFDPTTSDLEVAASPAPAGPLCALLGVESGVHVSIDDDTYWTNVPPSGSVDVEITNP